MTFTQVNTEGYSDAELAAFNAELAKRIADAGVEAGSDEAKEIEIAFSNEIASR